MTMRQHYVTDLAEFNGERVACGEAEANLVSSQVVDSDEHLPVLDLDFPCRLVESTTPGHFHLYLEREVTWPDYVGILAAFRSAGLIEDGFFAMSLERGATFVRKPGVIKQATDSNSVGVKK